MMIESTQQREIIRILNLL